MQFNVAQLLMEPMGSTRSYDLIEEITGLDPELHPLGPLVGSVELMRTHSGILARGQLSTAIQVTCNRCLVPIATPVRFTIEESFRPLTEVQTGRFISPDDFKGTEEELEDEALLISDHHILDMAEVVRQNIWLALPSYPGCNWEAPSPCPNFQALQAELQAEDDDVPEAPAIDPRWSALMEWQTRSNS